MKKAARGLRSLVPSIDLLISSPLRRAVETARIIADVYGGLRCIERDELAPGTAPQQLIDWLAQREKGTACIVGHEPDLSELLTVLLAEKSEQPLKLKKGSASLVTFEGSIAPSRGSLKWYRSAGDLASHP
jgi:phosphohistidine phosphatase